MRTGWAAALVCAIWAGLTGPAAAQFNTPMSDFLADPAGFDSRTISIDGHVSFDDYARTLFATREDFEIGRFGQGIPIVVPDHLLDRRDLYERRFVRVFARYDHRCAQADWWCSNFAGQGVLIVEGVEVRSDDPPAGYRAPPLETLWDRPYATALDAETPLGGIAAAAFAAIESRDREALVALAPEAARTAFGADFADPRSRGSWLLFTGPHAWRARLADAADGPAIILTFPEDPFTPRIAAACLCLEAECAAFAAPSPQMVTAASTADPFICLAFVEIGGRWYLDPGPLMSMSVLGENGGDLGLYGPAQSSPDGGQLVGTFFTTPLLRSAHFVSRMRERPRARVADAVASGRALPASQMRPSGAIWVMEDSGISVLGEPRQSEISAERRPDEAP